MISWRWPWRSWASARAARDAIRASSGQHEQLLGCTAYRVVEAGFDLLGRVDVRPVGRERAVLAVALACARERDRVIARERDPAHGQPKLPHARHGAAARAVQGWS